MKMMSCLATAAILVAADGRAAGQTPIKSPPGKRAASANDPDAKTCRIEDRTGSLFTEKVCRTRREWTVIDSGNDADADRVFRMRRGIMGKMAGPE